MIARIFALSVLTLVLTAGSILFPTNALARPLTPLSPAELQSRSALLQHRPWNFKSTMSETVQVGNCFRSKHTFEVWDPITGRGMNRTVEVRRPVANGRYPVVILIPTIKGTYPLLEPKIADHFCERNVAAIIADFNDPRQPAVLPAWGYEDLNNRSVVLSLRTVIDWATTVPFFNPNKIGMMGLSLGGITTALIAGVDSRLVASVVVVGAGNMPYTLAHSTDGKIRKLREDRMRASGIESLAQYEDKLRETLLYDGVYFAPNVKTSKLLMVLAEKDDQVPYVVQQETFKAFRNPESITFTGGHVSTIVQLTYLYLDKVDAFFDKKFAAAGAPLYGVRYGEGIQTNTHEVIDLDQLGL